MRVCVYVCVCTGVCSCRVISALLILMVILSLQLSSVAHDQYQTLMDHIKAAQDS